MQKCLSLARFRLVQENRSKQPYPDSRRQLPTGSRKAGQQFNIDRDELLCLSVPVSIRTHSVPWREQSGYLWQIMEGTWAHALIK